ncbi:MAG: hypothetical protein RL557_627 [archaeon]|jgi:hypothetical protein
MKKKRSPKDIIESVKDPHLESGYLKFKGEEMFQADSDRTEQSVGDNLEALEKNAEKKKKGYSDIHTHPGYPVVPSNLDFGKFLSNDDMKNMWIAQTDKETGEVKGYLIMRKTKKTPSFRKLRDKKRSSLLAYYEIKMSVLDAHLKNSDNENYPKNYYSALNTLEDTFKLKYRFVPAHGYQLSEDKTHFEKKEGGLEQLAHLFLPLGIVSILASLFFLSSSFTGYTIIDFSPRSINSLGILSFILGIFFLYLSARRK